MKRYLQVIVLFLGFSSASNSLAYSCIEESVDVDKLFDQSDVAIIGKVKKKLFDFSSKKDKYLVQVKSVHKGNADVELVIWTKSKCKAYFVPGEEYVIFLSRESGKLWTDLNRTWRIYEKNQTLTEEFINKSGVKR